MKNNIYQLPPQIRKEREKVNVRTRRKRKRRKKGLACVTVVAEKKAIELIEPNSEFRLYPEQRLLQQTAVALEVIAKLTNLLGDQINRAQQIADQYHDDDYGQRDFCELIRAAIDRYDSIK